MKVIEFGLKEEAMKFSCFQSFGWSWAGHLVHSLWRTQPVMIQPNKGHIKYWMRMYE